MPVANAVRMHECIDDFRDPVIPSTFMLLLSIGCLAGGYDARHGAAPYDEQLQQLRQLWQQQLRQLWNATHDAAATAPHVWKSWQGGHGP